MRDGKTSIKMALFNGVETLINELFDNRRLGALEMTIENKIEKKEYLITVKVEKIEENYARC